METRTIKIESAEGSTLIQNYLETFNKEIDHVDEGTTIITEIAADEDATVGEEGGTYFVDSQGQYYYQAAPGTEPVATSIDTEAREGEVAINVNGEQVIVSEEDYQTMTFVPADSPNGEVGYFFIVQQPEDGKPDDNQGEEGEAENDVYDFDENEDEESARSSDEDDKSKITKVPVKKKSVMRHLCSYCDYTSPRRYLLGRHMKSHSMDRPYKCQVCDRGFKTQASLSNHINTHTGIKPHRCKNCSAAFTTSGELVRHIRYRHTHEKPHKCTECDYASVELSKLKRHIRCHTGERPYQCPHCTYASPDTFKLKRHLRTHTGEKPYVCDLCQMCFTQSNSLKAHKLIHNISEKPVFACELCPTTCGRKTDLRIHVQKLHTSDKPLKCKRCGKSFPDRYSYKLHNKTHEGEKCYKCEICPYASASQRHLGSHMLKHTDEKPFQCSQCEQSFRQKQLLRRHQNLYHNPNYVPTPPKEKSHECRECGKAFAHKGNLIRHMSRHDPDSDHHAKNLALRMGRAKRVGYVIHPEEENFDGEQYEEVIEEDDTTELVEEEEEVEVVEGGGGEDDQYVVLEVIHMQDEDGQEREVAVVAPEAYARGVHISDDEQEKMEDGGYLRERTAPQIKIEKDMDTCFGFDENDEENEIEGVIYEGEEDSSNDNLTTLQLVQQ